MTKIKKQDVLVDKSSTGRERPWKDKKIANHLLSLAYDKVNTKKAMRLRECAQFLQFVILEDGTQKLKAMDSCRVRLCPICSWRRSLKIYAHTRKIMDAVKKEKEYKYIFLTLTTKNCRRENLNETVDTMMTAWNRFIGYKTVKQVVKGWYRGLEITHNLDYCSNSYDTFHPHFHCILMVNKTYFKNKTYLTQAQWTSLWAKAMRINYTPIIDVRRVKGNTAKDVAEVAKYTVKDNDYIIPDDWDLTVETVQLLDKVLDSRRLVAYGGKFKEWHKKLNLDDEVDGNLVNVDDEDSAAEETSRLVTYVWNVGYKQYISE